MSFWTHTYTLPPIHITAIHLTADNILRSVSRKIMDVAARSLLYVAVVRYLCGGHQIIMWGSPDKMFSLYSNNGRPYNIVCDVTTGFWNSVETVAFLTHLPLLWRDGCFKFMWDRYSYVLGQVYTLYNSETMIVIVLVIMPKHKNERSPGGAVTRAKSVSKTGSNSRNQLKSKARGHFWNKCLKKEDREFELLTKSDAMWFCCPCRVHVAVEKSILTDMKIAERWKEVIKVYEVRISELGKLTVCNLF